jgi:hypothetical protein
MANELYFPKASVALDDKYVLAGANRYELSDISYAEVVTRRYPVDWGTFTQVHTLLFLGFAAIWAIATSFGWAGLSGPILAIFWMLVTVRDAFGYAKRGHGHTLTLQTTSGTVEIVTSSDDDPLLEACEAINKRIKHNAQAPRPLQSGEPTRWIQTN